MPYKDRQKERERQRRRDNQRKRWKAPIRWEKSKARAARWRAAHREAVNAQAAARYAIKRGRLVRGVCVECGMAKVHAHHEDYSKPLEVVWLCSQHHRRRHMDEQP